MSADKKPLLGLLGIPRVRLRGPQFVFESQVLQTVCSSIEYEQKLRFTPFQLHLFDHLGLQAGQLNRVLFTGHDVRDRPGLVQVEEFLRIRRWSIGP